MRTLALASAAAIQLLSPFSPLSCPAHEPAASTGLRAPSQPALVPPESLPQGFIIVVEDKTRLSSAASPIYIGCNQRGWNPGAPDMKMSPRSDSRWQLVFAQPENAAPLEFKFTRGSWDTVEIGANLADIGNRRLAPIDASKLKPGEKPTIELVIEKFADQRPGAGAAKKPADPYRTPQIQGSWRRLQVGGTALQGRPPGAGTAAAAAPYVPPRDCLVWLPPGYDNPANSSRRYPVLYLMDGQNLFEQLPGVPGEWHADETASLLMEEGRVEPFIIVGIPNAGALRASEYMPFEGIQGITPEGESFVRFLLDEVKPRAERAFRIAGGPENTGIGGSSLGAVIALYAGAEHPDIFGRVLAESPALLVPSRSGQPTPLRQYLSAVKTWPDRVCIGMGGRETGPDPAQEKVNAGYVTAARALDATLSAAGLDDSRRKLAIAPEAQHNEQAWSERLPTALEFLFPPPSH